MALAAAPIVPAAMGDSGPSTSHDRHAKAIVMRDPVLSTDDIGRMEYTLGQSIFERIWISAPSSTEAADGLGPLFNARSCVACHPGGARPKALVDAQGTVPSLLLRLGRAGGRPDPVYGVQLQTASVANVPAEGRLDLAMDESAVELSDGAVVQLRRPSAAVSALGYGEMAPDIAFGLRIGPALHGIGPLDAIPTEQILALADKDDRDRDGISGRPAWLDDGESRLGRFGWKAVQPDMRSQNAHAFMADIGLSTEAFPDSYGECSAAQKACRAAPSGASPQYGDVEVSPLLMEVLDRFVAEAVLPPYNPNGDLDPATVARGKVIFGDIGCAACHRESYEVVWPAGATTKRHISPYTDLLLHDMGPGLAEHLSEGAAMASEWRTAPLWGLRWALDDKGEAALLHDGRARNLLEAILWHGGEAQAARDRVAELPGDERAALISFLSSL
jgi:CxxC motif-containing protein (DUF1111 family)